VKFNRISVLIGTVVLLALGGAAAYYVGMNKGSQTSGQTREPQQVPVMGKQAKWTTQATYGNWEMRCHAGAAGKKTCIGLLEVVDAKKHQMILGWLVGLNAKGGLSTTLQTPTGVLIGRGVDMQLGTSAVRHLGYNICGARGCEASVAMDNAFVSDLEGAGKATITLYTGNGKAVNIGIPVKGADQMIKSFQ
jgi:invasion protein IalB